MTLKQEEELVGSHHAKDNSANRRKMNMRKVSKGIFPSFLEIKMKEKKSAFRLARCGYCNFTIRVILVLMA